MRQKSASEQKRAGTKFGHSFQHLEIASDNNIPFLVTCVLQPRCVSETIAGATFETPEIRDVNTKHATQKHAMHGVTDLKTLLTNLKPILAAGEFVFVSRPLSQYGDNAELDPIASFIETEGLTLIVPRDRADAVGEQYEGVFRMITLQVHSSLNAVGLTAAVANALADQNISANVVAAFYHDHVFVPSTSADAAIAVLHKLTADSTKTTS